MKLFRIFIVVFLSFAYGCGTRQHTTVSSQKSVEEKYSQLLGVPKEDISNKRLYEFIEEWYGTPYQYGGKTKKGIDCSGFTSLLYKEVYGKEVSGSSTAIFDQCQKIPKARLLEGDLIFFKIDSKDVSHIGIYLQNNKFVHATTKAGVMIDDLNEDYYKKYFESGGKVK